MSSVLSMSRVSSLRSSARRTAAAAFLSCMTLMGGATATAQPTGAAAHGAVQDQSGAVVPGVTVTARQIETGLVRQAITDADGRYLFPQLAIGSYEFTAVLQGFQSAVRRGIVLAVGQDPAINLTLSLGELSETVVVTQEMPVVDTVKTAVSSVVDSRQIREMPLNGRDFIQLATLQAGVVAVRNTNTAPDKGTGIRPSFAGARPYQTGTSSTAPTPARARTSALPAAPPASRSASKPCASSRYW